MNDSILKKVKRIEISSRRMMDDIMTGGYKSRFRGQGVQFSEHRQYTPGDDIRHLDWKVSARSKEPLIKQYEEERELNVFIIADFSASSNFGSNKNAKRDVVTELGAMIAYAASNSGDKVGVLFVTSHVRKTIELKKGKNHVLRIIRDLATFESEPGGTGLKKALEETRRLLKHSGIVFVLSDFKADGYENALRKLSQKHDVIAVKIDDPSESKIPELGIISFRDPETLVEFEIKSDSTLFKKSFADALKQFELKTRQNFNLAGVETLSVLTTEDHAEKLLFFLQRRKKSR